jgi:hypothetical protein
MVNTSKEAVMDLGHGSALWGLTLIFSAASICSDYKIMIPRKYFNQPI